MSKILSKAAGLGVLSVLGVLLLGGVAQAAPATTPADTPQGSAAVQPSSETGAIIVGGLSFVLIVGVAGAVLWYTARSRRSAE